MKRSRLRFFNSGSHRICVFCWLLSVAAAEAEPLPVPANPETAELRTLSLDALSRIEVITPSKEPVPAFRTPMAIFVITGEQIRRSGATSIPEALRLAPGVSVSRIDGNKWAIGLRGFGDRFSRGVLVLIDGRTVYTSLLAGTYWEVQDTMMEDIDRIEVIRGPGGTIWGPNAVNGVINIITKSSEDTRGALVSVGGGNEEQGFAGFRYGGGNNRGLSYRVYGKAFDRGPESHSDGRNFDDWRAAQAGFRMDWSSRPQNKFTLQGDVYTEEAGESLNAVTYSAPYSRTVDSNADNAGGNLMARWTRTINDKNDIQFQIYYDRTSRLEANFGDQRNTFDVDFLQHLRHIRKNEITWGLGTRLTRATNTEVVNGLTFLPAQRTDQLVTGFLQDEISLVDRKLSLTLGTKLLHTNFTDAGLEPSARLLWTPDAKQTIWLAFTHALRTPSDAEENFALSAYGGNLPDGTPIFARLDANRQFGPEQLNGYELGYRRLVSSSVAVGFASFYNHYHNLEDQELTGPFVFESNPAPTHILIPAKFGNGLLGTTKGGEITPNWQVRKTWLLRGSYSFLQMNIKADPRSGNLQSLPVLNGSSPRHQVTMQSSTDLSRRFSLDIDWRYVSQLAGLNVPAYATADARLGWKVGEKCELSLVGQNLLQPSHPEFSYDPAPLVNIGRGAYARLTWTR